MKIRNSEFHVGEKYRLDIGGHLLEITYIRPRKYTHGVRDVIGLRDCETGKVYEQDYGWCRYLMMERVEGAD